jgi:hypothetical protein
MGPVIADQLSGEEIKRLAGIDTERVVVRQDTDRNTIVPDSQRIRVADGDVFTHHARHSKATAVLTHRLARVRLEAAALAGAYPGLKVADDGAWVLVEQFRLPAGWVPDRTTVMIVPPPTYPQSAPDGFYLAAQLRRRNGAKLVAPGHYFKGYHNPYADLGWWWYCLQDPHRHWDPGQDSLLSFVEAIRTYLGTAD